MGGLAIAALAACQIALAAWLATGAGAAAAWLAGRARR